MTVWPAIISALCALLGTLAGFCATVRRQAADMAQIRSRLDCLTELGEEIRRDAQAEGDALRREAETRLDAAADLIVGRVVKD